jgi:hypothetical protein
MKNEVELKLLTSIMLFFGSFCLVSTRISRQNDQQQINNLEVSSLLENKVFFLFGLSHFG